jgi:cytochrome c oxidase assembly factor CtaG
MRKNSLPRLKGLSLGPAYDSRHMLHRVRRLAVDVPSRALTLPRPSIRWLVLAVLQLVAVLALLPITASAHGAGPEEPSLSMLLTGWSFDPLVWGPTLLAGLGYWWAVRKVDREHPTNPAPHWRMWSWMAGLAAILVALASPIEFYDTTLFSAHMIQHLLLTMVAAPLLVLGAPITLLLRVSSPGVRRKWILPVLHSRVVRAISHPLVAWGFFAGIMWFTHFSPMFDAALEDEGLHRLEHILYLTAGLLFWWPVAGADPSPHRMSYPGRLLYLGLGMPLSSFLGLVIFSARHVLYDHYLTLEREWGWSPLLDQAWAGGIMWAFGDGIFVLALVLTVAAWLRHEEREGTRVDARLARQRAAAAAEPTPDT